uniref:TRAF-type domain-containing protein n=1 Tax=Rhabditophanes sp. KR3021 TaxID=114890 RepID=A0AC35TQ62_9BILA
MANGPLTNHLQRFEAFESVEKDVENATFSYRNIEEVDGMTSLTYVMTDCKNPTDPLIFQYQESFDMTPKEFLDSGLFEKIKYQIKQDNSLGFSNNKDVESKFARESNLDMSLANMNITVEDEIVDYNSLTSQYKSNVSEFRSKTPDYKSNVSEFRSKTPEYMSNVSEFRSKTPEYMSNVSEFRSKTPDYKSNVSEYMGNPPAYINNTSEYKKNTYSPKFAVPKVHVIEADRSEFNFNYEQQNKLKASSFTHVNDAYEEERESKFMFHEYENDSPKKSKSSENIESFLNKNKPFLSNTHSSNGHLSNTQQSNNRLSNDVGIENMGMSHESHIDAWHTPREGAQSPCDSLAEDDKIKTIISIKANGNSQILNINHCMECITEKTLKANPYYKREANQESLHCGRCKPCTRHAEMKRLAEAAVIRPTLELDQILKIENDECHCKPKCKEVKCVFCPEKQTLCQLEAHETNCSMKYNSPLPTPSFKSNPNNKNNITFLKENGVDVSMEPSNQDIPLHYSNVSNNKKDKRSFFKRFISCSACKCGSKKSS